MGHSIWIDDKNTFTDFSIVPVTRPVVNMPEAVTVYVDTHGFDGPLDLSEAVAGRMVYGSRTGSWDFQVKNYTDSWDVISHRLANYTHGRRVKVRLEDDPEFYYLGRLELDTFSSAPDIRINYTLEPYKYDLYSANEPWLWDPFSFETGVIREYGCAAADAVTGVTGPLTVNGNDSVTVTVEPSSRPAPILVHVETGTDITVKINSGTYAHVIGVGTTNLTDATGILFADDAVTLKFSGHGTVWVEYRGGWL